MTDVMGGSAPIRVPRAGPAVQGRVGSNRLTALRFVLVFGLVSGLGDVVYEGARSITGPLLASFGAGAALVGLITGAGEGVALVLRLPFGVLSDRTGRPWPITIAGYAITMVAAPLLAVSGMLWSATVLTMLERFGKAVRTPAPDTMLAQASTDIGRGRAFALHEALDQSGAVVGPLLVAAAIAAFGTMRWGFAVLVVPAVGALAVLAYLRQGAGASGLRAFAPSGWLRAGGARIAPAPILAVRRVRRRQHARFRDVGGAGLSPPGAPCRLAVDHRDHVCARDGRGGHRGACVRMAVRPRRPARSNRRAGAYGRRAVSVVLHLGRGRLGRSRRVGAGPRRAREHDARRGRRSRAGRAPRCRLRRLHGGLRAGMACGQHRDRSLLRPVDRPRRRSWSPHRCLPSWPSSRSWPIREPARSTVRHERDHPPARPAR